MLRNIAVLPHGDGFSRYLPEDENRAIKPMCVFMRRQRDLVWQGAMEPEMERLKQRGFRIQYKIEPKEPHLIQALRERVKRLFDQSKAANKPRVTPIAWMVESSVQSAANCLFPLNLFKKFHIDRPWSS